MSGRAVLLIAVVGLGLATVCLALSAALDSAVLAVGGAIFVAAVLVAREGWLWAGQGRQWLVAMTGLGVVVAAAFVVQQVAD